MENTLEGINKLEDAEKWKTEWKALKLISRKKMKEMRIG